MDGKAEDARKALAVRKGFKRRGDLGTRGRNAATSAEGNSGGTSCPHTDLWRVRRSWGRPKSLSGSGGGGSGSLETPRDSDRRCVGEGTSRGVALVQLDVQEGSSDFEGAHGEGFHSLAMDYIGVHCSEKEDLVGFGRSGCIGFIVRVRGLGVASCCEASSGAII